MEKFITVSSAYAKGPVIFNIRHIVSYFKQGNQTFINTVDQVSTSVEESVEDIKRLIEGA